MHIAIGERRSNYGIPGLYEAASKLLTAPFAESFRREKLAVFQQKHAMRSETSAENQVRAVRLAISRLHKHLAAATDGNGQPHPVLRPFADHVAKHFINPLPVSTAACAPAPALASPDGSSTSHRHA